MEKQEDNINEIDLTRIVKVLIKRKWLIIIGTVLSSLSAVIICLILPKVYQSNGFFQLSRETEIDLNELKDIQDKIRDDIQTNTLDNNTLQNNLLLNEVLKNSSLMMKNVSIPAYKKYEFQFTNPQKFLKFIENWEKSGDKNLKGLKKTILTSEDIAKWIEPVYAYSKRDLKELTQSQKDVKNFVLGVRIKGEQYSHKKARTFVFILGKFIKDSILYGKLSDFISTEFNKSKIEYKKYDNFVIKDEFKLKQLTTKSRNIKDVLKKYPHSRKMPNREVVSIENKGHRYLSPVAQMVGIESYIADIKENYSQNQRNKQLTNLRFDYFSKLKEILVIEKFGESLLSKSMKLKDSFFKKKELQSDIILQVKNELSVDFDNFLSFTEEMQFISGPTLPDKPIKPKKTLIVTISFILALFIFVFLAFFVDWWKSNKDKL